MKRKVIITVILICLFHSTLRAQNPSSYPKSSLKNKDAYSKVLVTGKVLEALGKISDPKAKEVLVQGLKSKEFYIRAYAAEALGKLNDKEAISLLKGLVNDENYLVRIYATVALIELGDTAMEKSLLNFLNSDKPEIRANVVEKLGDFGDKYLSKLLEVLSKDNSYLVRIKAIEQLGRNKFMPAIALIRKATEDENAYVRRAACFSLGEIGDKKDEPLLKTKLKDNNIPVRSAAKEALSLLKEPPKAKKVRAHKENELIKLFRMDLENKDPFLLASSYLGLANLKDTNILPRLLKEVASPESGTYLRLMSARALRILNPHIFEIIDKALVKSKGDILSTENLEIGYKINGRSLLTVMIEALKDQNDPLHQDAPLILLKLEEKSSLPALREALFQEDPNIVSTAAYALGELRDKDAVDDLIKVTKEYGF